MIYSRGFIKVNFSKEVTHINNIFKSPAFRISFEQSRVAIKQTYNIFYALPMGELAMWQVLGYQDLLSVVLGRLNSSLKQRELESSKTLATSCGEVFDKNAFSGSNRFGWCGVDVQVGANG